MRTERVIPATLATMLLAAFVVAPLGAGQAPTEAAALQKDIAALKQRIDAMEAELAELRRSAPAAVQGSSVVTMNLEQAPTRGSVDAPLVLVEVSDFQCPFCARYARETLPQLIREYVEAGKVRYAFVNLPLPIHRFASKAAEAAACARDQGKFWELHDQFFANQAQLAPPQLVNQASALGLKVDTFQSCLDNNTHAAYIRDDVTMVQRAGVTATPTFFIGTVDPTTKVFTAAQRIVGAKPVAVFRNTIDALLTATASAALPR